MDAWDLHKTKIAELFPGHLDDLDAAPLKACQEAVARARVTQLETVICKTLLKSKKPRERIHECFASYADETRRDGVKDIWKGLAKYIQTLK